VRHEDGEGFGGAVRGRLGALAQGFPAVLVQPAVVAAVVVGAAHGVYLGVEGGAGLGGASPGAIGAQGGGGRALAGAEGEA
jgi:hypothetical protein